MPIPVFALTDFSAMLGIVSILRSDIRKMMKRSEASGNDAALRIVMKALAKKFA